ncbi:MAG TPA: hypothetical protein EYP28_00485 [Methanophagales archaeon]|nr:hypothetical protein [Methanophagales archaeon]
MSVQDFQVIEEKIFAQDEQISFDDARKKADDKRLSAFSLISKIFSRPDANEIVLSYSEKRYEPFWYLLCNTHLEYNRSRVIEFEIDNVVRHITIYNVRQDKPRDSTKISIDGSEYCVEDLRNEIFWNANTGERRKDFKKYIGFSKHEMKEIEELMVGGTIVVPAKVKASIIIRNFLAEILNPVKADEMLVEDIRIEKLYLLFRPVYAFEYHWQSKGKYATLEVDGLTREVKSGGKAIKQKLKESISEADLFDIGADAVDLFIPGGGLALKLSIKGRAYIKKRSNR